MLSKAGCGPAQPWRFGHISGRPGLPRPAPPGPGLPAGPSRGRGRRVRPGAPHRTPPPPPPPPSALRGSALSELGGRLSAGRAAGVPVGSDGTEARAGPGPEARGSVFVCVWRGKLGAGSRTRRAERRYFVGLGKGLRRRPSRPPLNLPPPGEDVPPGSAAPQLAAMGPGPRNLSKRFPSSFRPAFPEPVPGLGKAVVPLSGSGRRPRSVPCREIAGGGCHSAWRDDRSPCRGSVRPVGSLKSSVRRMGCKWSFW